MGKRSEAMEAEMEEIRQQMKRVDAMLILARRVATEAAVDTSRMDFLERYGIHELIGKSGSYEAVTHTLRETVDGLMAKESV